MDVRKIVVTGPECTGKTTLSKLLAEKLNGQWIPEYSREYLSKYGPKYDLEDIKNIAKGIINLEESAGSATPYVFDTEMLVLKVWSDYRFKTVDQLILERIEQNPADLMVLCKVEIPWEEDPLRENPNSREELYDIYLSELKRLERPFIEVSGTPEERADQVVRYLLEN